MSKVAPDEASGLVVEVTSNGTGDGEKAKDWAIANGEKRGTSEQEETKDGETTEVQDQAPPAAVGCFALFRFADGLDVFLMIVGSLAAMAHGVGMPMMILVFGEMTNAFVDNEWLANFIVTYNLSAYGVTDTMLRENATARTIVLNLLNITDDYLTEGLQSTSSATLVDSMSRYTIYYIIIGCAVIVAGYVQTMCWMTAAERQTKKIRRTFFWAIMRQEIGWFDTHDSGELNTRLSDDLNKIHDGIGDKIANFLQWMAAFFAGIIIGFVKGWKLTLVMLAVSPLLAIAALAMNKVVTVVVALELKAYAKAGAIAEEVIGNIRTVVAFGGQKKECDRYNANLTDARSLGAKKALAGGLSMGFVWFIIFAAYALGFYYGSKLVREERENYDAGTLLLVFFAVIIAAFSLGSAFPNLEHVGVARGAAYSIYNIIDQEPVIDSSSEEGEKPTQLTGDVELSNIVFNYPSRPDTKVLQGLDLQVSVGRTAALVGPSGCGKSTVVQLLQRFYDPLSGTVKLDGRDIRELNIKWLRTHIGVVSQEPVLFATTIADNIRYGHDDVTEQEIEQACKMANAYDFIQNLPNKYETIVGERGAQLSGGQKQRVAIARALVRNPRILLLDEATSALDTESEAVVQEALDKASKGRTTIVIAHRLSTIKTADVIFGIKEGKVAETGSHDQLMSQKGLYHTLVINQTSKKAEEKEEEVDEKEDKEELALLEQQKTHAPRPRHDTETSDTGKTGRRLSRQHSEEHISVAVVEAQEEKPKKGGLCSGGDEEESDLPPPDMGRVFALNKPEWYFIVLGCFGSIINGAGNPVFAILFAEILGVFTELDIEEQERKINLYCLLFLVIGMCVFVTQFFQAYMFGLSGEALTMRLRQMSFKAMLTQEIAWFDDPKNNTGALTTRLATEASQVQGATGVRLGMMVKVVSTLGTCIILAFVYGWQLTLVILAFVPVMMGAGLIQMQVQTGSAQEDKQTYEDAGKISTESISNIRTVATLTKEQMFHTMYMEKLEPSYKTALYKAHMQGVAYGCANGVIFFAYAAAFYYGAFLVRHGIMNFEDVMKVFSCIIYGAMGVGEASAMAPDYGKATSASAYILFLLDRESQINSLDETGDKPGETQGSVELEQVRFRYPTRPHVAVLRGIGLKVSPGQTVALVGSSGCGKSTVVQLIERFYDPLKGQVNLDGKNLPDLNVQWLRSQLGIVSQEPILFDASIRDNIAYGDNSRDVPMEDVITAARAANIHSFVDGLPNGYDTNVGDKGTQLSGGQKQRVAIARALVRQPKILLLDEATSALDTESEKVVQEALDRAQAGRTCIVIAHRLSTIQGADVIAVIHHGQVVEQGSHSQLMAAKGRYYMLQQKGQKKDS